MRALWTALVWVNASFKVPFLQDETCYDGSAKALWFFARCFYSPAGTTLGPHPSPHWPCSTSLHVILIFYQLSCLSFPSCFEVALFEFRRYKYNLVWNPSYHVHSPFFVIILATGRRVPDKTVGKLGCKVV